MIKQKFSSKMGGFVYFIKAKSTHENVFIELSETTRASSEREALELFEEWISENLEGFDWEITVEEIKGETK